MEIRNLGASGLRVSAIGLGCNNFGGRIDLEATRKVIHKAFDLGITLFDTADTYGERGGSETCMGQVLGDDRKRIVLATKFGMPMDDVGVKVGGSRRYIMNAVEDSLRRLRTDWIDLYQIHQPDPHTPIEETLRALDDLIHQGKVRYVGCSNFPAWQVMEAYWTAKNDGMNGFVSCQDEYSLVFRKPEAELMPAMRKLGLGLLPFSNCVHYEPGSKRRESFHRFLREGMRGGYAAEDGAALHFTGTELSRVVASRPQARGYRLDVAGQRVVEMRIATTFLGERGVVPIAPVPEALSTAVAA